MRFNNEAMQELTESWDQKAYDRRLDELSDDIKNLERFLKRLGAGEFDIVLGGGDCRRLMWLASRVMFDNDADIIPLIECPVSIRLICEPHLHKMLEHGISLAKESMSHS